MNVPYEATGRVSQKLRTRAALVAAARGLLSEGTIPTLDAAAAAASISRTTAYRYFRNQHGLLVAAYPHIEEASLLDASAPADASSRLAIVAENQTQRILAYEKEMRAVLRLSLDDDPSKHPDLPMNRGLRIGWITDALAPLRGRLSDPQIRRLVLGIGATLGIEAFVWLTDVARLTPDEAAAVMCLNAVGILTTAMTQAGLDRVPPDPPRRGHEPGGSPEPEPTRLPGLFSP